MLGWLFWSGWRDGSTAVGFLGATADRRTKPFRYWLTVGTYGVGSLATFIGGAAELLGLLR
jgi:hypothetical protein